MPVPNPEHLLDHAAELATSGTRGAPRQVNLRRAVSAAYYAVFHRTLTAAADHVVGIGARNTTAYALVYHSIDHAVLRDLCDEVRKTTMKAKYRVHAPAGGFDAALRSYATAVIELRERRHAADYDPMLRLHVSDADEAVKLARGAIRDFETSAEAHRTRFLSLLLFSPR